MKKRSGYFNLSDNVFSGAEKELIEQFLQHLSRVYQFDLSDHEFSFRQIGVGLSKTAKLIAKSDEIYPYFLKISDEKTINKEVSNFNRAQVRIPPLHLPPLERVIHSTSKKVNTSTAKGHSLLAFRYIAGTTKGAPPTSFFDAFGEMNTYELMELVDEIFQVVLFDLHNFKNAELKPFEHFSHDVDVFAERNNRKLNSLVAKYNETASGARSVDLPHGMLHGDLHCENIILNNKLTPVLIDFEMLRLKGCLLNDFAEFEIALIVAALDHDVDAFARSVRSLYSSGSFFQFIGVDKTARAIRAVRSNLAHSVFQVFDLPLTSETVQDLEYTYNILLLRYICSYSWVASKSMPERRSIIVRDVLHEIFETIEEKVKRAETAQGNLF